MPSDHRPLTGREEEARTLEWLVARLKQTEAALARVCEELREERRRAQQATRFLREYRRLYRLACLRAAARPDGFHPDELRDEEDSSGAGNSPKSDAPGRNRGRVIPWAPLEKRRGRRFDR